jgi:hypothetical protein
VADTDKDRCNQGRKSITETRSNGIIRNIGRAVEPDMVRVVDGLAYRMERSQAIGNGWDGGMVPGILEVTE